MDTQKKTSNKRTLIIIAVGGILVTCLCLVIIAVVYSPTKSSVSQKTTQDSKVKVLNTETLTLDMGNTVLPKPTDMLVQTNTPAASKTPGPTNTPAASRTPRPTNTITATPNPNLLKPGVYLIGKDIKPGIYKGEDAGCYWERLKDLSGSFDSIIANGNTNGTFYIEVKESDAALSTNCDVVLLDPLPEHTGEYPQTLEPGVYLVGIDIKPGTYKGEDAGCYWERLKDLSGSFDAIIANDNTNGQFYIEVNESDAALSINCEVVLANE